MDIFYKPPNEGKTECDALESNYINCLMQKAIKDKTIRNYCVLDNVGQVNAQILWFHLECPKRFDRYNQEGFIRQKIHSFYEFQKSQLRDFYEELKDRQQIRTHSLYAQDIEFNPALVPTDKADEVAGRLHFLRYYDKPRFDPITIMRKYALPKRSDLYRANSSIGHNFNEE